VKYDPSRPWEAPSERCGCFGATHEFECHTDSNVNLLTRSIRVGRLARAVGHGPDFQILIVEAVADEARIFDMTDPRALAGRRACHTRTMNAMRFTRSAPSTCDRPLDPAAALVELVSC